MSKFLVAFCLVVLGCTIQAYPLNCYDNEDPDKICYEGKTKYDDNEIPHKIPKEVLDAIFSDNKVEDPRTLDKNEKKCPAGFVTVGGFCFPDD